MSTLWSSQCSTGIHQTTETSTVNTKAERNSPHCVSSQYPPSRQLVLQHAASTLNLLEELGFTVNYVKSVLVPSQQMEFLGSLVDSVNLSLSLHRDKIRKIQLNSQLLLDNPITSVRELSKLLGLVSSSIQAVFPASLRYQYLQQAKNAGLKSQKSCKAPVILDSEALREVQWWKDNLIAWNEKALFKQSTDSDRNQHITSGLGGLLPGCFHKRQVGPRRDLLPHKLPGTSSRFTCREMLYQKQGKSSGSTTDGQHFSSNIYQQDGGSTLTPPVIPCQEPLGLVSQPQPVSEGSIHSWDPEFSGRPGIQSIAGCKQLETETSCFQLSVSDLGAPEHRPISTCVTSNWTSS